jgi:hypothetical protein
MMIEMLEMTMIAELMMIDDEDSIAYSFEAEYLEITLHI